MSSTNCNLSHQFSRTWKSPLTIHPIRHLLFLSRCVSPISPPSPPLLSGSLGHVTPILLEFPSYLVTVPLCGSSSSHPLKVSQRSISLPGIGVKSLHLPACFSPSSIYYLEDTAWLDQWACKALHLLSPVCVLPFPWSSASSTFLQQVPLDLQSKWNGKPGTAMMENSTGFPQKNSWWNDHTTDPAAPRLYTYLKEVKTLMWKDTCTPMFTERSPQ